jgi:hypothetical protein
LQPVPTVTTRTAAIKTNNQSHQVPNHPDESFGSAPTRAWAVVSVRRPAGAAGIAKTSSADGTGA